MKLESEQIQLINALDAISGVTARDCLVSKETVTFMVPEKFMSKAIGKNGANVKAAMQRFRKRVELFEHTETPEKFIEKAFGLAKLEGIEIKVAGERKVAVVKADAQSKKIILGNIGRLKKIKELCQRNYEVDEIRVR